MGSGAGCGRGEGPAAARPLLGDAGMFTLLTAAAAGGGAELGGWAAARLAVGKRRPSRVGAGPAVARAEAIGPEYRSPQSAWTELPRRSGEYARPDRVGPVRGAGGPRGASGSRASEDRQGRLQLAECGAARWLRELRPRELRPPGSSAAAVVAATGLPARTGGTLAKTRLRAELIGHRGYLPLADWLNRFGCHPV